jgi:DNA polymerase-3 subunit gamma/tau
MTTLRLVAFAPSGGDFQVEALREPAPSPVSSPSPISSGKKAADALGKPHPMHLPETVFASAGREEATDEHNEWHTIFAALKVTGATRQLAQNCELINRENDLCLLRLPPAHQALLLPDLQEKLREALSQHFGLPIRLSIEVASPQRITPAELRVKEQARQQEEAVAAIEADPFVREAIESLDARVDQKSIKPLL